MDFIPKGSISTSQGFHEEDNNQIMTMMSSRRKFLFSPSPTSSSSSPASSSPSSSHPQQKAFFPLSLHQHHQTRRGGAAMLELMETLSGGEEGKEEEDENNNNNSSNRQGREGESDSPSDALALGLVARGSNDNVVRHGGVIIEKEHMFDKVVTPSDVGKLNRLVIPKQHAERYFPLDSSTNDKGLLLNFEDMNGKPWRFRYSYWNSSQSYVMTKGWSRFVKEKKLDAGDIVSFQRGVGDLDKDRLFIDWRSRPEAAPSEIHLQPPSFPSLGFGYFSFDQYRSNHHYRYPRSSGISSDGNNPYPLHHHHHTQVSGPGSSSRDHELFLHQSAINYHPPQPHPHPQSQTHYINSYGTSNYTTSMAGGPYGGGGGSYNVNPSLSYHRSSAAVAAARPQVGMMQQRDGSGGGGVGEGMVYESVPVVQGNAAAKRLRLFGVNMDCPIPNQSTADECTSAGISPSPNIPLPQLRQHSAAPGSQIMTPPPTHVLDKGKSSSSSFDLDI